MAQGGAHHGQATRGDGEAPDAVAGNTMAGRLRARLTQGLDPVALDIGDESDRHAGHAGHRPGGGTHFRVRVVSAAFIGLTRVARHRLVMDLVRAELAAGLHALALTTLTPDEAV